MAFRINKADFQQVLARVQPGLATVDVFEQSAAFCFAQGWLMTFNGEIACRTKSGLPLEFEGAVRAKPLADALEAVPDEQVELDLSDPAAFRVAGTAGRRKWFAVRMEAEILLPLDKVEYPDAWHLLPEDFGQALKTVLPCAGKKEEEFVTACVHVTPEFLECCDRLQICRYHTPMPCDRSFLFRAKSAKHLMAFDVVKFGETENWVHFRNAQVIFSCTRHDDAMPDLSPMLEFRGTKMRLSKETEAASKLAGVFSGADKADDKVTVELRPGRMVVVGRGAFGEGSYPVETSYNGPPLSFRVAPLALAEMVKMYDSCEVGQDAGGNERLRVDGERWVFMAAMNKADDQAKPSEPDAVVDEADYAAEPEGEDDVP